MDSKPFTKGEIDKNFKRSYDKLMANLEYLEDALEHDETDLRLVRDMKIELKSLKYFRN